MQEWKIGKMRVLYKKEVYYNEKYDEGSCSSKTARV